MNIATMGALRSPGHIAMYCSSKAALIALTRSMADEWAPLGIRVNAIAPGPFMTGMLDDLAAQTPGFLEYSEGVTMLKRSARPEEIVGTGAVLCQRGIEFCHRPDTRGLRRRDLKASHRAHGSEAW